MEQTNNASSLLSERVARGYSDGDGLQAIIETLRDDKTELHLWSFIRLTSDAIISLNEHEEIFFWNRGAQQMFGYTEDEALGQKLTMMMPERFRQAQTKDIERMLSTGRSRFAIQMLELVALHKDGKEFSIELSFVLWSEGPKTFVGGIVRDISERKRTEEALRASTERFHTVISNAPVALFALDLTGICTFAAGKAVESLGLRSEDVMGVSIFEIFQDVPQVMENVIRALRGEPVNARTSAHGRMFDSQYMPLYDAQGHLCGTTCMATDITELLRAEAALRSRKKRYSKLTEQADLVLIIDAASVYRYASPSHQRIVGYRPEELIGTCIFEKIHPADLSHIQNEFEAAARRDVLTMRIESRLLHANGSWVTLEGFAHNCLDDPDIQGIIINARDITERVLMEKQLHYQLEHDILTSLPNRALLLERMTCSLREAADKEGGLAFLVIDVNRFKDINDTFGYQYGDLLLQQVSARLCEGVPFFATVARLGGDKFAILLPDTSASCAYKCAEAIRTLFDTHFIVKDVSLQVDVSIGATLYPEHGSDTLTLMRHADVAMYAAKQAHKGYVVYDVSYEQFSARRLELTRDLRRALALHEFVLHYQPTVEVKSGIVIGVEALVRWYHPSYGMVPPDRFIPLAEQTGLIHSLTLHLLEMAIQQCHSWLCAGIRLRVAVNLSMWDLREPHLPEIILDMLQRYEVPPELLRLELTEGAVMDDAERSLDVLMRLSALGTHISIDDFGTGYSSLSYLTRLPVDELKIDRSFVLHITDVKTDATIVRSTITLAHNLGLRVVAEGVENLQALKMLQEFGCDIAQGYYLSRPLPPADLERWLDGKNYVHA